MSYLIPSIEVLIKLSSKLILSLFNNFQIIFVGSTKFLELSNDFIFNLLFQRIYLLFDFFIDDFNFNLFITLPSFEYTLNYFCDLLIILFMFFFF